MTSNKPNPPIDLSHAKEQPRSLSLDETTNADETDGNAKEGLNVDELLHEKETAEDAVQPQTTIAYSHGD